MAELFDPGAKFRRWLKKLKDPEPVLKGFGALMVSESKKAFKQQRFGAKAWDPRGVPNVYGIIADYHGSTLAGKLPKRRFEPRKALINKGQTGLLGSIDFKLIGNNAIEVGSNLPYAGRMHEGGPIESLPINKQVRDKLKEFLKGKGKPWRSKLGFLFSKKMGETLKGNVEPRPFVGITDQTIDDFKEVVRTRLFGGR